MSTLVVVWGSSGFIGRGIVEQLIANGAVVRGISRTNIHIPEAWGNRYQHYCHNFHISRGELLQILQGASCAIHCVGHVDAAQELLHEFVESVSNLTAAALEAGVKKIILASSLAIYGTHLSGRFGVETKPAPDTPYGESRLRAEESARLLVSGTSATLYIVRIPAVIGLGMRSIVLTGLFKFMRFRFFLHPGSMESCFACIGIKRLTTILSSLAIFDSRDGICIIQVVDNLRWIDLVNEYKNSTGRHVTRLMLPGKLIITLLKAIGLRVPGPLWALVSQSTYENSIEKRLVHVDTKDTIDEVRKIIREVRT